MVFNKGGFNVKIKKYMFTPMLILILALIFVKDIKASAIIQEHKNVNSKDTYFVNTLMTNLLDNVYYNKLNTVKSNGLLQTVITLPNNSGINLTSLVHDNASITKLVIPNNVSSMINDERYEMDSWTMENFTSLTPKCPNLVSIELSKENKYFAVKDNVLYTKDMKRLVYCPPGKSGKLVVPEGVEIIGIMAFQECAKITSIQLPATLKQVQTGAFGGNKNLKSLTISNNNKYFMTKENVLFYNYGEQLIAYAGGKDTKSYVVPKGVKAISPAAFMGCNNLIDLTICEDLTDIGNEAFRDCISLKKIIMKQGIHDIAAGAFMNCSNLTQLILPEGLRGIYQDALEGCDKLLTVKLPSTLTMLLCDLSDVKNRTIECYSPFLINAGAIEPKNPVKIITYKNSNLDKWYKRTKPSKIKLTYFKNPYITKNEVT